VSALSVTHLGPTSYRDGLRLQEALVRARVAARAAGAPAGDGGASDDWLLYPDHPPVLTVGRSPSEGNLQVPAETLAARGIEVFEVARGGDITWHGPGQLVGYPVCDLDRRGRDLHRFLRDLERALINALAQWGVEGRQDPGRTGIWVGDDKLASIGIAVRRWVSYHGFALNVRPNMADFDLIHPCGLHGIRMTSLARLLGERCPSMEEARQVVTEALMGRLGYSGAVWKPASAAWEAAGEAVAGTETPEHMNSTAA
jgi:lipoate-protein ligase B